MVSLSKTQTRHHAAGKVCHHYAYHGLTCDEYDSLRARANGRCEICGIAEEDTPRGLLVIDHFGEGPARFVRGLLCDSCNGGVMPCIDGRKVWGENRKWEARAREYEANSWQSPPPEAVALLAARTEMPPKYQPRPAQRDRMHTINLPSRRGVPAMADTLRRWLTAAELAELAALLAEESSGTA